MTHRHNEAEVMAAALADPDAKPLTHPRRR
jgi:hypothetical protein